VMVYQVINSPLSKQVEHILRHLIFFLFFSFYFLLVR